MYYSGARQVLGYVGYAYENEAIRRNLDGSFARLLLAVEQHPAMLLYLDNAASAGPDSPIGRRRERGLNENLAREILELHTLGVDGGYTQEDVTALARMITGWSVDQNRAGSNGENSGQFVFRNLFHEPGTQILLGKKYGQSGVRQGEQALKDLATHPATARHIAHKLVKHFVADDPPLEAVSTIERVFLATEGHLPSVHEALIGLEDAWQTGNRKFKTTEEFLVSLARAALNGENSTTLLPLFLRAQQTLGQAPFTASSPAGWPDDSAAWAHPDAILKRVEWVNMLVQQMPPHPDPLALHEEILPGHESTRAELSRAESTTQAMVLLFANPQFQWRGA